MTEQRFVDLETKLAHQEHLLLELNDIITKQQENIMRLEKLCDSIIERVRSLSEAAPADANGIVFDPQIALPAFKYSVNEAVPEGRPCRGSKD
jgi:SlyX protein